MHVGLPRSWFSKDQKVASSVRHHDYGVLLSDIQKQKLDSVHRSGVTALNRIRQDTLHPMVVSCVAGLLPYNDVHPNGMTHTLRPGAFGDTLHFKFSSFFVFSCHTNRVCCIADCVYWSYRTFSCWYSS